MPDENETTETTRRGTVRLYAIREDGMLEPVAQTFDTITDARRWFDAADDHDLPLGTYRPVREYADLTLEEETVVTRKVREA